MPKTWLTTGAGRGMGVEFAHAALAAGHNVVATGRNPDIVRSALGEHECLLVTALDVTDPHSAEDAVAVAVERFGRVDALLNNAGASWPASSRSSHRAITHLAFYSGWPQAHVRDGGRQAGFRRN